MAYKSGDHYVLCDICNFKRYRSECVKTWDNLLVCRDTCFDGARNPQDYAVHPLADKQMVTDPRPEHAVKPTILETVTPTSIADTTATSGGNITNNGGSAVTEYGVCWATAPAPDTDDDRTSDGTGTGEYTSLITLLTASTKYYLRAYAVNSVGTRYGPSIEFTTTA